jgi:hypothetical protein
LNVFVQPDYKNTRPSLWHAKVLGIEYVLSDDKSSLARSLHKSI